MDYKFCPYCGKALQKQLDGNKKRWYCNQCKRTHYRNPTVGVAVIILKNNNILLVERRGLDNGKWCIPCGHVEWGEEIRAAAIREIKEETDLDIDIGPVFTVHSNFHDMDHQTVGVWFWGNCKSDDLQPGSDASAARFFSLDDLPDTMAFPTDLVVCRHLKHWSESKKLQRWLDLCFG